MARKLFQYDKSKIKEALQDIEAGMSVNSAHKKYGIPRATLTRHKHSEKVPSIGRKPVFTQEQERFLSNWIINMAKAGFPLDKETFLRSVAKFKTSLNIKCEGSRNWYEGFLKRNPDLSLRSYQNLTKSRASVRIEAIHNWFTEVEKYLSENGHFHILNEPRRVFNADESAFYLNPKGGKVLAQRGSRFVYLANSNDEKENVTVLLGGNALGELAPPMAVFRYKRMPETLAASLPENWTIGRSENGWMTQETMFEYVANYFYPWLVNNGIKLPIIFFLDGHVSHLSMDLAQFCSEKGIILVALYPNATHLLQPMDVAVFKTLKMAWKSRVQEWRVQNDFRELKKHEFCPLLEKALQDFNKESLCNGFKKCGLVPWNRDAIEMPLHQEPIEIPTATPTDPFRKLLEKRLTETKLQSFRANTGPWAGDVCDTSLYYIWLKSAGPVDTEDLSIEEAAPASTSSDLPEWHDDNWFQEDYDGHRDENTKLRREDEGPREEIEGPREENENPIQIEALRNVIEEPREEIEGPGEEIKIAKFIVPSPFKKNILFRCDQASTSKKTIAPKVRMPAVISSPEGREYLQKKEDNKKRLLERREKAKQAKEEKKRAKHEEMLAKKLKRDEKKGKKVSACKKLKFKEETDESDSDGELKYSGSSSGGDWQEEESETDELGGQLPPVKREKGEYVAVKYDEEIFPGVIIEFSTAGARVKAMKRNGQLWKWPDRENVCFYEWMNVLGHIEAPKKYSTRRGIYSVPELYNI